MDTLIQWSHPHSSITYRWAILSKAQHKQVHFVFSAPADTEAKTLCAFLQLHREVIKVLRITVDCLQQTLCKYMHIIPKKKDLQAPPEQSVLSPAVPVV